MTSEKAYLPIPAKFGLEIRNQARTITRTTLALWLMLRDYVEENYEMIEQSGWMQFYEDAGDWTDYSADSIRKGLSTIRNYEEEKLVYWTSNGLSMNHIETANILQEVRECQYDAAQLLDAAIQLGNKNGKRMTVKEMEAFALGEKISVRNGYSVIKTLCDWIAKIPQQYGWDDSKKARFTAWAEAGKEFFQ
jgi:hypothetical protein